MGRFSLLASAVFLAGCADPNPQDPTYPYFLSGPPVSLSADEVALVQGTIASALLDPASARFVGPMAAVQSAQGPIVVCGYVNGTNTFGGRVGDMPFMGLLVHDSTSFSLGRIATDDVTYRVIRDYCAESGAPI
jgi:hypothetical protein